MGHPFSNRPGIRFTTKRSAAWTASLLLVPLAMALSVAAPSTRAAIVDDFNTASDAGWTHYEPLAGVGAGVTYSFPQRSDVPPDYAYRMVANIPDAPTVYGPARGGSLRTDATFTDFTASADIVTRDNTHDEAIAILGRITNPGLTTTDGYALSKGGGSLNLSRLTGEVPTDLTHAQVAWNDTQSYRLVFTIVGTVLTGTAYNLIDALNPPVTITYDTAQDAAAGKPVYTGGYTGLAVYDNSNIPVEPAHTADATWDNFAVAAVPEPAGFGVAAVTAALVVLRRRRPINS